MVRGKSNELEDFIEYTASRGIERAEVQTLLLQNGWPQNAIDKIFVKKDKFGLGASTGKSILLLHDVTKRYGANLVLDKLNLAINPGEIFGVIGLSGSGKTTLFNTMVGFVQPDSGSVIVKSPKDRKDYKISSHPEIVSNFFGFAAQHPSFYDKLTVEENVNHFASLYNLPRKERKERSSYLVRLVGLEKSKNILAQNLSGGMQKRLDIACSLVHEPKVLILDEPTADLDPVAREEMWDLIRDINSRGTTVILASHFVNELEELCSRFAILHNKHISEVGTPDELKVSYSKNYEIIIDIKSGKYDKIIKELKSRKSLQVQKTVLNNRVLTIFTSKPEQTLFYLAKMVESMDEKIIDVRVNRPTIKELFESLVRE